MVIGTLRYMAPEQLDTSATLTGAADVFAWGGVLCFAAGALPFGDGPPAVVAARVVSRPADLSAVPAALRELVAASLDKDPAARPTPRALLDALSHSEAAADDPTASWLPSPVQEMLADYTLQPTRPEQDETRPVAAPTTEVGSEQRRPARRNLAITLGAGGAVVAAVGVALVVWLTGTGSGDPLVGSWSGVDTDGSDVVLQISAGPPAYTVELTDSAATICGGEPLSATSTGRPVDGAIQVSWAFPCAGGTQTHEDEYRYDAATATLTDLGGVTYHRD